MSRAGRPNGQGRAGTKASGGREVRRLGGPWAQLRGGHDAVAAVPAQRARAARPAVSLEARARAVRGHARPHPATGGRRIVRARALRRHRGQRDRGQAVPCSIGTAFFLQIAYGNFEGGSLMFIL